MKTTFLAFLCLFSLGSYSQVSIKDTFELYVTRYQDGLLTLAELDSSLSGIFASLPYDDPTGHYEKVFQRSMYFWKDRIHVDELGQANTDGYVRALLDYLNEPICANGDEANWDFHFDPSPVHGSSHRAGIITAVYQNPTTGDILAGAGASGIWREPFGATGWEPVTDHLRVPALGINEIMDISKPSEPEGKYLLAVTGTEKFHDSYGVGVLKSNDYGVTWTKHAIPEHEGKIEYLLGVTKASGESNRLFAASTDFIYVSTDRGYTWAKMTPQPPLGGDEKYFSIESSEDVNGSLFVTSKKRYIVNDGHIWRYDAVNNDWNDDLTANVLSVLEGSFGDLSYVNTEEFETDFGDYTAYTITHDGTSYSAEREIYGGDYAVRMDPILTEPVEPGDPPGLWLGQLAIAQMFSPKIVNSGETTIEFMGSIPEGASVKVYFGPTAVHTFDWGGDPSFRLHSVHFDDIADVDGLPPELFILKFACKFDEATYNTELAIPIIIDDLSVNLNREGPIEISGIGTSNIEGDESYVVVGTNQYIADVVLSNLYFLSSADQGNTWTPISQLDESLPTRLVMTGAYGENKALYYGTIVFNRLNFESGIFNPLGTKHADVRSIQIVGYEGGENQVLVGDDGGVSFSSDGGSSWTSLNGDNLPITQFYGIGLNQFNNTSIIGGTQDNGTFGGDHPDWHYVDGGDGGSSSFSPASDWSNKIAIQNNKSVSVINYGFGVGSYNFVAGTDADVVWFLGEPIEFDPVEGKTLFTGFKRADGGQNATLIRHDLDYGVFGEGDATDDFNLYDFGVGSQEIGEIEVSPANPNRIYAAEGENRFGHYNDKLFVSNDYGETFTDLTLAASTAPNGHLYDNDGVELSPTVYLNNILFNKNVNAIETDPLDENRLWIGLSGVHTEDGEVVGGKFKVLKSENGGLSWRDYSTGLPPFPINDLVYQKGTNDRLFAATDAGVFYRDATMDEWVCFQQGMPATFVTDLEINDCKQELFAGTFGRGIWKTTINLPDSDPYIINSNVTWGGVQQIDHDIIIKAGNHLTLNGTLEMAGNKRIIVEPNARFTVDGGTITNACGAFWRGIEAWGSSSDIQTATYQGWVELKNGAIIEHAEVAVALWHPGYHEETGGMLFANSSTFKNNKKDVEFYDYQNFNVLTDDPTPNVSFFTDITFEWDDDFRDEFPLGHVTLYQTDGVRFRGCTFADYRTEPDSRYLADFVPGNAGIRSIDAQYFVLPLDYEPEMDFGDWTPTTFVNLDFGIHAANVTTERNIAVDRCFFKNNLYGVELVDVNTPAITRNVFAYTNEDNNFDETTELGVHFIRSKELTVQENIFLNVSAPGAVNGIASSDLGESDEDIYKNEFNSLDIANVTQGKNRFFDPVGDLNGKYGLQFQCNFNNANYQDHLVLNNLWGGLPLSSYGVRFENGALLRPSGTVFSESLTEYTGEDYEHQAFNALTYYYNSSEAGQNPDETLGTFGEFPIEVPVDCPSKLADNPYQEHDETYIAGLVSDFNTYTNQLATKEQTFTNLVNGGNTDSLLTEIANLTPTNSGQLRQTLLSFSPYLTRNVVEATLDNTVDKYPHAWAYELVMANIDVAYEPGFMDFLSTKTAPLPTWMIDDIQAELDSNAYTNMRVLRSEIGLLYAERANAANQLILNYKNDTTTVNTDSVAYWIAQKSDMLAETRLVDVYLQQKNYTTAQNKVNSINTAIQNYPAHLQDELTDFVSFKTKLINLLAANSPLDSLSTTDHDFMTDMATNAEGLARYQAQALLCFFYDECAEYPVVISSTNQSMMPIQPKKENNADRNFEIYPNPAQNFVTIVLPESEGEMRISIMDLTGRLIYQTTNQRGGRTTGVEIWDTQTVTNGTYLITVSSTITGEKLGTQKVVVQH